MTSTAETPSSGRVTRNAVALTFRMILVTLVGLYTSRVLLETLGVDDFGIYGVIGGVVALASFINASMGGATSRFITFELGKGDVQKLKTIFSSALIIHFLMALAVVVLAETIGLWFVNHRMNFPPERMTAVNVLYQFTIFTMVVNFTQVPYTATILAHENMRVYAFIEILNACLKLGAIYLVIIFKTDKLILYGTLVLVISSSVAMIYRYYCIRKYPEAKMRWSWDNTLLRKMLAFCGFDLYGNMCGAVRYQGIPLILNIFFGVVANAASTISMAVATAVKGLTTSITQAFRPQIIKQYAVDEISVMSKLMLKANQFTLLAFALVGIPVFFEAEAVLRIWLGEVPPYAVEFLRLVLISAFIEIAVNINNVGIHATGNVKYISFISGTFYLLCPVSGYLLMKFGNFQASLVYYIDIITMGVVAILGWLFLHIQIPGFQIKRYVGGVVRVLVSVAVSACALWGLEGGLLHETPSLGLLHDFIIVVIAVSFTLLFLPSVALLLTFDKNERSHMIGLVLSKLKLRRG